MPEWDYSGLFKSFAPNLTTNTVKARSAAELDKLLSEESFQNATIPQVRIYSQLVPSLPRCTYTYYVFHLQCIDMTLDKYDAPAGLRAIFDFKKKMAGA